MDSVRVRKRPIISPLYVMAGAAIVLLVIFVANVAVSRNEDRPNISKSSVARGDMTVTVSGFGKLESKQVKLLSSLVEGAVTEIYLKPGDRVTPESKILAMENTRLLDEHQVSLQKFAQAEASFKQLTLAHRKDLLEEMSVLASHEARRKTLLLTSDAYSKLGTSGAISGVLIEENKLAVEEASRLIETIKEKIDNLKLIHIAQIDIAEAEVAQARSTVERSEGRVKSLDIRGEIDGVLLDLKVGVGQRIEPNHEIGLVGSDKDLIATIKVSQSDAPLLKVGMLASIDTRSQQVSGSVARVSPVVRDGFVSVDISVEGELPVGARISMDVNAEIVIEELKGILVVDRAVNLAPFSTSKVYVVDDVARIARPKEVRLGYASHNKMQVLSGLNEGDQIIVSDTTNFSGQSVDL